MVAADDETRQTAKQDGDRISKHFLRSMWKTRNEPPNVGGVSIRSRNIAPSRKGCVVNGQMTKASNERVRPRSKMLLVRLGNPTRPTLRKIMLSAARRGKKSRQADPVADPDNGHRLSGAHEPSDVGS